MEGKEACGACGEKFIARNKGYNRTSATALGDENTVKTVFPSIQGRFQNIFICDECRNVYSRKTVKIRGKGLKRKLPSECVTDDLQPPIIHLPTNPAPTIDQCEPGQNVEGVEKKSPVRIFEKATEYLQNYKYLAAFRNLVQASNTAKTALIQVAGEIIMHEVSWYRWIKKIIILLHKCPFMHLSNLISGIFLYNSHVDIQIALKTNGTLKHMTPHISTCHIAFSVSFYMWLLTFQYRIPTISKLHEVIVTLWSEYFPKSSLFAVVNMQ